MIPQYIYELLLDHDYVSVPGLGGFVCQYKPASIEPYQGIVKPPSRLIAFNKALHQNDGLLIQYLLLKESVSLKEAEIKVHEFVSECLIRLKQYGSVQFPKIGRLYLDDTKNIQFTPSQEILPWDESYGLRPVQFKPIPRIKEVIPERTQEEEPTPIIPISTKQRLWPYRVAASIAGIFLAGSIWFNMGQPSLTQMEASFFQTTNLDLETEHTVLEMDNNLIKSETFGIVSPQMGKNQTATDNIQSQQENTTTENSNLETPAIPTEETYQVVVGAFKGPISASRYKDDLIKKGYNANLLEATPPNKLIKVVIDFPAVDSEVALRTIQQSVDKNAWLLN